MAAAADSLLAFMVVAKSSRGADLVYAYPAAPQPVPRSSVPLYPSARSATADHSGSSTPTSSSSESDSDFDELLATATSKLAGDQFLGLSHSVLASLLTPSRELCDQPFELVVDHLAFVGHPVWLGDEELARSRELVDEEEVSDNDDDDDEGNLSRGRPRLRPGHPSSSNIYVDEPALPRRTGSPLKQSTEREADQAGAVDLPESDSPDTLPHPLASITSSQQSQGSIHGSGRLTSFNFVCIIDTPPDSHLSSHLEGYYKDVVIPVTANLKVLEKKDRWLGKEAAKLRKAREKLKEKGELTSNDVLRFSLTVP